MYTFTFFMSYVLFVIFMGNDSKARGQRLIFNDLSKKKKINERYDVSSSSIVTNARNKIESLHYGLYLRTCLSASGLLQVLTTSL